MNLSVVHVMSWVEDRLFVQMMICGLSMQASVFNVNSVWNTVQMSGSLREWLKYW